MRTMRIQDIPIGYVFASVEQGYDAVVFYKVGISADQTSICSAVGTGTMFFLPPDMPVTLLFVMPSDMLVHIARCALAAIESGDKRAIESGKLLSAWVVATENLDEQ